MFNKDQLSVGNWLAFMLLMLIPIVNIVLFIVILISPDANKSLKNYLVAQLLLIVVGVVVITIFMSQLVSALEAILPA
jgi:hypothetical protein